jgi:hypothetical protein
MFIWTCVLFQTVSEIESLDCIAVWFGHPVASFLLPCWATVWSIWICVKRQLHWCWWLNFRTFIINFTNSVTWTINTGVRKSTYSYISYQQVCGLHSNNSISETVRNRTRVNITFFVSNDRYYNSEKIDPSSWDILYMCMVCKHSSHDHGCCSFVIIVLLTTYYSIYVRDIIINNLGISINVIRQQPH